MTPMHASSRRFRHRRAFNLVELLIALAISAALLTATLVALDASFKAYEATTEEASTHTVSRLAMHRVMTMIRSGQEFGPVPADPRDTTVFSDFIEFLLPDGQFLVIEWREASQALWVEVDGQEHMLLGGVLATFDPDTGDRIPPFTLEYELGRVLYRATVDLTIVPDDNQATEIDRGLAAPIRMVASAMPRGLTF